MYESEEELLNVTDLKVAYGGVTAVDGVSFEVDKGTCVALIGANGAGKTSTLRAVGGLVRCDQRSAVSLNDQRIDRMKAETRARLGLGHVLEGRHIFPNLTVRQNLEMGLVASHAGKALTRERIDDVTTLFPEIEQLIKVQAGALSGGQQQFLVIARALLAHPKVLLLDEPTIGLAPMLIPRMGQILGDILKIGTPLLLAEQSLELVRRTASIVHILHHGKIVRTCSGDAPDLEEISRHIYLS